MKFNKAVKIILLCFFLCSCLIPFNIYKSGLLRDSKFLTDFQKFSAILQESLAFNDSLEEEREEAKQWCGHAIIFGGPQILDARITSGEIPLLKLMAVSSPPSRSPPVSLFKS